MSERIEQRQPVRQHDAEARKVMDEAVEGAPVGAGQSLTKAQGDRKRYGNREQCDHERRSCGHSEKSNPIVRCSVR